MEKNEVKDEAAPSPLEAGFQAVPGVALDSWAVPGESLDLVCVESVDPADFLELVEAPMETAL